MKIIAEAYRIRAVAFETPAEEADADKKKTVVVDEHSEREEANGGASNSDPPRKNDGSLDFGR